MKIKKCQKCGSENIFNITINPNRGEEEAGQIECQDCGFQIRRRTEVEIVQNLREKNEEEKDEDKRRKSWEDAMDNKK